jgi:hypothetical protein
VYDSSAGITSASQARTIQYVLSYKPAMFSVLFGRDMLFTMGGLAILMTVLSYMCADLERAFAAGTAKVKERPVDEAREKARKDKIARRLAKLNRKKKTATKDSYYMDMMYGEGPQEAGLVPMDGGSYHYDYDDDDYDPNAPQLGESLKALPSGKTPPPPPKEPLALNAAKKSDKGVKK